MALLPKRLRLFLQTLADIGHRCRKRLQRPNAPFPQLFRVANVQLECRRSGVAGQANRFRESRPENPAAPGVIYPAYGPANPGEFRDGPGTEPLSQSGKVRLESSPSIRPSAFHHVLNCVPQSVCVEGTGFRPAKEHGQRVDVLTDVVEAETHALDQCGSASRERIVHATDSSVGSNYGLDEHGLHLGYHHRGILDQSLGLLAAGASAKRPIVPVVSRQSLQFSDYFLVGRTPRFCHPFVPVLRRLAEIYCIVERDFADGSGSWTTLLRK